MDVLRKMPRVAESLDLTGETLWARTWFGQFRELVMKSAVRNIERAIEGSNQ